MYVYMYLYMRACFYMFLYVCIYVIVYAYIYVSVMETCTNVYIYVSIYKYMKLYTSLYMLLLCMHTQVGSCSKFYHPNLEFAVEKMMHSPYLTKPYEKYPGMYVCFYIYVYTYMCLDINDAFFIFIKTI